MHQTINVLMLGHKASLSDAVTRADVCPSLNNVQLRKLLSLYTSAADIGEAPVPLSLLSLLASEDEDAVLLLSYSHSTRLAVSDLHYVQPKDGASLASFLLAICLSVCLSVCLKCICLHSQALS